MESGHVDEFRLVTEFISPLSFLQKQQDVYRAHQPGTGSWFLNDPRFKEWADGKSKALWCHGKRMNFHHSTNQRPDTDIEESRLW